MCWQLAEYEASVPAEQAAENWSDISLNSPVSLFLISRVFPVTVSESQGPYKWVVATVFCRLAIEFAHFYGIAPFPQNSETLGIAQSLILFSNSNPSLRSFLCQNYLIFLNWLFQQSANSTATENTPLLKCNKWLLNIWYTECQTFLYFSLTSLQNRGKISHKKLWFLQMSRVWVECMLTYGWDFVMF